MTHALQDVTDVLDDPDFHDDTLAYIRRSVGQQPDGSALGWPRSQSFVGVVVPDGGEELIQLPEGNQTRGDITVYSRFELTAGDGDTDADLVLWDGKPHRVIAAQTYRFGQQFTVAICQRTQLSPSVRPDTNDAGFLA